MFPQMVTNLIQTQPSSFQTLLASEWIIGCKGQRRHTKEQQALQGDFYSFDNNYNEIC